MKSVDELLMAALRRPRIVQKVRALAAARHWGEAVGEPLAGMAEVCDFDDGVLWLSCQEPAAAAELRLRSPEILRFLNSRFDTPVFTELRTTTRAPRRPDPGQG